MKLRRLSVIGTAVVVVAAGFTMSTGLADAAVGNPDLAIGVDKLLFQPPVSLPDIGTTQVRLANVGNGTPAFVRLSFQTGALIDFVLTDVPELTCVVTSPVNGRNVAICTVPQTLLDPGEGLVVNATVQIRTAPPPAEPGGVPRLTVAASTIGDPNGATASAPIGR